MALARRAALGCAAVLAFGCGDDGATGGGGAGGAPSTTAATGSPTGTTTSSSGATTSTASTSGSTSTGMSLDLVGRCGDEPPMGAPVPAPPPGYSGGTCPAFAPGVNTFTSGGSDRSFILVLPSGYDPTESYPLVFLWHWLGGDANEFLQRAEVQLAADTQGFIAVIPEKKGSDLFTWPMDATSSQARVDEELGFFDDMLSCVVEAYSIDTSCVSSIGVSAGALWTSQLAHLRSTNLASFVSLSGGTGGIAIKPWQTAEHKLPGIVLWGGDTDTCQGLLSFRDLSHDLEGHLTDEGHFFLECIHNCGHSEPPFEAPMGYSKYKGMWDFVLDHPYWNGPGASVYTTDGLSPDLPEWCAIGQGNAMERTGECLDPSQC